MKRKAAAVMLILMLTAAATPSRLPMGPDAGDVTLSPFYRWAAPLPKGTGTVLRQELLAPALTPATASTALRLLYTSTDWRWHSGSVPVSGALFLPKGRAPRGGWPLVIWSHGTLGVSDACAPSWLGANARDRAYISRWLDEGYVVAAPDYQGLGGPGPHPYTQWQAEGRSVLDAARAALHMGLPIANRIVITGQSQGSGAALGAARLAATYAPELAIKGAIATALLPTIPDPGEPLSQQTPAGSPYYTIYRMQSGSLPKGSPPVESYLTDKGNILLQAARTRCDPRLVAQANDITNDNAFALPLVQIDAQLGPAGKMDAFKVRFPLMLGIGLGDELIPPQRQLHFERLICRAGNVVVGHHYADTKHSDTLNRSANDAVAFARAVLAGDKPQSTCP